MKLPSSPPIETIKLKDESLQIRKKRQWFRIYVPRLRSTRMLLMIFFTVSSVIITLANYQIAYLTNYNNDTKKDPCALLFFGLMKSFENVALPAIREKILKHNSHCDIILHTYDLNTTPLNSRNGETIVEHIDVKKAYLLTKNVVFEKEEEFFKNRQFILEQTRKNFNQGYGKCCLSHDNMIKQWNSIAGAWDLMRQKEINLLGSSKGNYYKYVGLFRTDTFMVTVLPSISGSVAVAPAFDSFGGQNDRMFYGSYENARIWADRFAFYSIFETKYMKPYNPIKPKLSQVGYHSEYYLGNLMKHHNITVKLEDICIWRIRNQGGLSASDCDDQWHIAKNLPNGYDSSLPITAHNGKIYYHWSKVWDDLAHPAEWKKWEKHLKSDSTEKGVIMLSMHGSESSQLYSLLTRGYGYYDGGNNNVQFTIPRQNDAFLWGQGLDWKSNVEDYKHLLTLKMLSNNTLPTLAGTIGLDSLTERINGTEIIPWLMEDPRFCITLKSWLTFLKTEPAIIIIYRHPLDVARKLMEEEEDDSIKKFLLLWIQYNKAALQNSKNLCRVFVDITKIHENINNESGRIVNELSDICGVKQPPLKKSRDFGESFFVNYHNDEPSGEVLKMHDGCEIHDYETQDSDEKMIYMNAMQIYCDLKSGKALDGDYEWPSIKEDVVASVFKTSISRHENEYHIRKNYVLGCKKFTTVKTFTEKNVKEQDCHMVTSHPIKDSFARFIIFQQDIREKLDHLVSHYTNVESLDNIIVIDHQGMDEFTSIILDSYGKKGMHVWRCDENLEFKADMWSYVIGKYAANTKFLYPLDYDEYLTILSDGELLWSQESFRMELLSLPTLEKPYKTLRSVPIPVDCPGHYNLQNEKESHHKANLCRLQYTESDVGHYCSNKCFYRGEFFKGVSKGNVASNDRDARACRLRYQQSALRNGTSPIAVDDSLYYLSNFTVLKMQNLEFNEYIMHIMQGSTATNYDSCSKHVESFQYCWDFQAFKNANFDMNKMREIYRQNLCNYNEDDPRSKLHSLNKVFNHTCQNEIQI